MPSWVKDEEKWKQAKAIATREYGVSEEKDGDKFWRITAGIYKRMMRGKLKMREEYFVRPRKSYSSFLTREEEDRGSYSSEFDDWYDSEQDFCIRISLIDRGISKNEWYEWAEEGFSADHPVYKFAVKEGRKILDFIDTHCRDLVKLVHEEVNANDFDYWTADVNFTVKFVAKPNMSISDYERKEEIFREIMKRLKRAGLYIKGDDYDYEWARPLVKNPYERSRVLESWRGRRVTKRLR